MWARRGALLFIAAAVGLGSVEPASAATVKRAGARAYAVTLSAPERGNANVVRMDFRLGSAVKPPTDALKIRVRGAPPANLLTVGGRLFPSGTGKLSALATVVLRAEAFQQPAVRSVTLLVSGARLTRTPVVYEEAAVFTPKQTFAQPQMCHGRKVPTTTAQVRSVFRLGLLMPGFSNARILAGVFNAACQSTVDVGLRAAVTTPAGA